MSDFTSVTRANAAYLTDLYAMANRADLAIHVANSQNAWACIPLPPDITEIPDSPFEGMSVRTVVNAPPQLLAHIIRTKANSGVQVLSPRATPMLSVVERIDPWTRQADHLVVTTQASANTTWPTVDGRDVSSMFPHEPNRSAGADSAQVTKTKTRVIGKALAANSAADPISRAVVRAAAVIDVQRRADVAGDADALAEVLDVAWGLPLGTFSTLAPLVLASSQDLLRTAISSAHNGPDVLTSIQRKKVIHVYGGTLNRASYGANIGMDWARQRAIARTIYNLSTQLEGMDLRPNSRTWAAADVSAPIHSSERDKHLVFQPVYGSALCVDPSTFRFLKADNPPPRFARCLGLHGPNMVMTEAELATTLAEMVKAGLPPVAASAVEETFRLNKITRLVLGEVEGATVRVRGSDTAGLYRPRAAALALAHSEMTSHLKTKLARGAAPGTVIRSRIYDVMGSVDAAELVPVFRTMSVLMAEASRYGIPNRPYALLRQLASRLSHTLGSLVVQSLAQEADRVGSTLDEWMEVANGVMPKPLRSEGCSTLSWATFAVWSMWAGTTAKWVGALKAASHKTLQALASASMKATFSTVTLTVEDPVMEAASAALAACKRLYAPYYESMYDYYALLSKSSPFLVPLGVGAASTPAMVSQARWRASLIAYTGACLWQLRGRHLRTARLKKIALGAPQEVAMERRINCSTYEIAIMVAPNKAYESLRKSVGLQLGEGEVNPITPGTQGDIREVMRSLPEPLFDEAEDVCDRMFQDTRLARYVLNPSRWVEDLMRTYDEVALEVATAALNVGMGHIRPVEVGEALPVVTERMASFAPASRMATSTAEAATAAVGAEPALVALSTTLVTRGTEPNEGRSGWAMLKEVYGNTTGDVVADMEHVGTEEQVGEVLNARYITTEAFLAAVDEFYGEFESVTMATSNTTAALNT